MQEGCFDSQSCFMSLVTKHFFLNQHENADLDVNQNLFLKTVVPLLAYPLADFVHI